MTNPYHEAKSGGPSRWPIISTSSGGYYSSPADFTVTKYDYSGLTAWALGTSYALLDQRKHNSEGWQCIQAHISAADTEPGVGKNWSYFWQKLGSALTLSGLPTGLAGMDISYVHCVWVFPHGKSPAIPVTPYGDALEWDSTNSRLIVKNITFNTDDVVRVELTGPPAGYDPLSGSTAVTIMNPDSLNITDAPIIDVENLADSDAHYAYVDLTGYKAFALQGLFGGTTDQITVTVEGTVDDAQDITARNYKNVTAALLNLLTYTRPVSYVQTDFIVLFELGAIPLTSIRVKYQRTSGTANDADLDVWVKAVY